MGCKYEPRQFQVTRGARGQADTKSVLKAYYVRWWRSGYKNKQGEPWSRIDSQENVSNPFRILSVFTDNWVEFDYLINDAEDICFMVHMAFHME